MTNCLVLISSMTNWSWVNFVSALFMDGVHRRGHSRSSSLTPNLSYRYDLFNGKTLAVRDNSTTNHTSMDGAEVG